MPTSTRDARIPRLRPGRAYGRLRAACAVSEPSLAISRTLSLPLREVEWTAIRAQGAGGQHVNTSSTAVQLRFDVPASSLPETVKQRLLARRDRRITRDGVVVIKSQGQRSQERNRQTALERLREMLAAAAQVRRARKPTRPSAAARRRRMEDKSRRGRLKSLRGRPED